jgi:hypothetical protein
VFASSPKSYGALPRDFYSPGANFSGQVSLCFPN